MRWSVGLLLALGLVACSSGPVVPVEYEDLQLEYGLSVPAGWSVTRGYANTALLLRPPVVEPEDHLYSLSVAADTRWSGATTSLDDYLAFRLPRMLRFTSLKRLDATTKKLLPSGMEIWEQSYQYRTGPQHFRANTRLFISGGRGWAVTVTAPAGADQALWQQLLVTQGSWKKSLAP